MGLLTFELLAPYYCTFDQDQPDPLLSALYPLLHYTVEIETQSIHELASQQWLSSILAFSSML